MGSEEKRALITGITGQDGSYLAELLISKGYHVYGIVRRASSFNTWRIDHIYQDPHDPKAKLKLYYGDLTDSNSLYRVLREAEPDEVYNLGAQSHVRVSFDIPVYTADAVALGTVRLLETIRQSDCNIKFYQASSSELFGKVKKLPLTEETPFYPRSPYGFSKLLAYWATVNYREAYGMHASNGILFNHESPRRGPTFVTRKITRAIANIKLNKKKYVYLGNLDAKRDWGYAGDYVEAMRLMLKQKQPDDYVIATGETHTVREFAEKAFDYAGLNWKDHVRFDPRYLRPSEVEVLLGDPSKARKKLGWKPKVGFNQLVKMMVDADIEAARENRLTYC